MNRSSIKAAGFAFLALAVSACAQQNPFALPSGSTNQSGGNDAAKRTQAKSAQYLYIYNSAVPANYARYTLPELSLKETTSTDGVASPQTFDAKGLPYFADESSNGGFGIFQQPVADGTVDAKQLFYGVPCYSSSISIGPNGNFYVVQYCSTNVLEFTSSEETGKPKKPVASYTGGNLGKSGDIGPTAAIVDRSGNLYVGDTAGGVTFFAAGSKKGVVAFATGNGGYVNQMVVDKNDDVWSIHGPNPAAVYFSNKTQCMLDPSGDVVRNEFAERFSKGKLAQHLYTATTDSKMFGDNGLSIAIDSTGRIYTGSQNADAPGIILDYNPGASCPNDSLSFTVPKNANPHVAVDAQHRFYVTDYIDNQISVYTGDTKKRINRITQKTGYGSMTYSAINP
jgi:hypothetical protein